MSGAKCAAPSLENVAIKFFRFRKVRFPALPREKDCQVAHARKGIRMLCPEDAALNTKNFALKFFGFRIVAFRPADRGEIAHRLQSIPARGAENKLLHVERVAQPF